MKNDLICKQDAIDALDTIGYDFSESELSVHELEEVCEAVGNVRQDMISRIKNLPSAELDRKKGKWIIDGHHMQCNQCGISICDKDREGDVLPKNFCLNCGTDMRGKEDEYSSSDILSSMDCLRCLGNEEVIDNERNIYTRDNGGNVSECLS